MVVVAFGASNSERSQTKRADEQKDKSHAYHCSACGFTLESYRFLFQTKGLDICTLAEINNFFAQDAVSRRENTRPMLPAPMSGAPDIII